MKQQICAVLLASIMCLGQVAGATWVDDTQVPGWLNPGGSAVTEPTGGQQTTGSGTVMDESQVPIWLDPSAEAAGVPSTTQTLIPSTDLAPGTPGTVTTNTGDVYPTYWLGFSSEEATHYLTQQDPELASAEVLTYEQIEPLVRSQNKTVLANQKTLESIEATDIEQAIEDMEEAIDAMEQAIAAMQELSNGVAASLATVDPTLNNGLATITIGQATVVLLQNDIAQMQSQLAQMESQLEELKKTDYEPYERQFAAIENQLVQAAQSAYIGLMTIQENYMLTVQQSDLTNVKYAEMQTRQALGQVSELTVEQTRLAKEQTDSAIATLEQTFRNAKGDFNLLLGREASRNFLMDTVPAVTPDMLALLVLDSDMQRGESLSYDIYAAEKAVEDAEDLDRDTDGRREKIEAAEYQLESTRDTFEQNFTKLFRAVAEKNRLLSVARDALSLQQRVLETEKLKYDRGTIARNAYIEAQVNFDQAQSNVRLAQIDLFAAYMQYQWACEGVMSTSGGM